jgi:hypothetical protein
VLAREDRAELMEGFADLVFCSPMAQAIKSREWILSMRRRRMMTIVIII